LYGYKLIMNNKEIVLVFWCGVVLCFGAGYLLRCLRDVKEVAKKNENKIEVKPKSIDVAYP